jgi:hypothetical protein
MAFEQTFLVECYGDYSTLLGGRLSKNVPARAHKERWKEPLRGPWKAQAAVITRSAIDRMDVLPYHKS